MNGFYALWAIVTLEVCKNANKNGEEMKRIEDIFCVIYDMTFTVVFNEWAFILQPTHNIPSIHQWRANRQTHKNHFC